MTHRSLISALLCMVFALSFVACNPNTPVNPYNPQDHPEDSLLTNWEKCMKYVKPGIYQGLSDEELKTGTNMGFDDVLLAVCEDGSSFYIKHISGGTVIPTIVAFDGDLTFYEFDAKRGNEGYEYNKKITKYSKEKLTTYTNLYMDINTQLRFWAQNFGFDGLFYNGTMIDKYFRRIDDAKNFNSTFEKMFNYTKHEGSFVPADDFFVYEHTIYGDGWHNELYPASMNDAHWVVPYTGNGTVERFSVYRQRNWAYDSRWYLFYGPCDYELVFKVSCDVACDREAAIAEYDLIKGMTDRYNYISPYNDVISDYVVSFEAWSNDEGMNMEGYKGYINPYYKMLWQTPISTIVYPLTIDFEVTWTTYV